MSETVDRLTMAWPKGLKQQVREKNGPRGLTEFVVEAVELHLKGGAGDTIKSQEKEVNELKWLVQLLADRIVMGGSDQDRREALMEVEFPSWVDTNGWPSEWAKLVKPEVAPQPVVVERVTPAERVVEAQVAQAAAGVDEADVAAPEPDIQAPVQITDLPHDESSKDDLFARIMARTGGDLTGFENLKVASEVSTPEPKPMQDLCPTCNEELVDGECWTCG